MVLIFYLQAVTTRYKVIMEAWLLLFNIVPNVSIALWVMAFLELEASAIFFIFL